MRHNFHFVFVAAGILGNIMKIDENGDSEGNFTVLAIQPSNFTHSTRGRVQYICDYYLKEVGKFHHREGTSMPVSPNTFFLLSQVSTP